MLNSFQFWQQKVKEESNLLFSETSTFLRDMDSGLWNWKLRMIDTEIF